VRGLLDGVTVAMLVMAAALPVIFREDSGEGRLDGAEGGTTVMTVRGPAGSVDAKQAVLPVLFHLMWRRVLVADLASGPLGMASLVWLGGRAR
jgi:hypothetical protein